MIETLNRTMNSGRSIEENKKADIVETHRRDESTATATERFDELREEKTRWFGEERFSFSSLLLALSAHKHYSIFSYPHFYNYFNYK